MALSWGIDIVVLNAFGMRLFPKNLNDGGRGWWTCEDEAVPYPLSLQPQAQSGTDGLSS